MIKVTIWNEYRQERLGTGDLPIPEHWGPEAQEWIPKMREAIQEAHKGGAIHDTIKGIAEECEDIQVVHIANLDMPECGLTEEVLNDTDVLIWWSHIAQDEVPYEVALRVRDHVWKGMGMIFLHSAHMSRPMQLLMGTSCTLRWEHDYQAHIRCCNPNHPIARGVDGDIYLEKEEMYGEFFDIPTPDELVFITGFDNGEVFRSGCVWNRGYGKVFYFQPGHESNTAYQNSQVRKVIQNAIHYVVRPEGKLEKIECTAVKTKE